MRKDWMQIEVNFRLPEGYRHRHLLRAKGVSLEIELRHPNIVEMKQSGPDKSSRKIKSWVLDWIQETIETARYRDAVK